VGVAPRTLTEEQFSVAESQVTGTGEESQSVVVAPLAYTSEQSQSDSSLTHTEEQSNVAAPQGTHTGAQSQSHTGEQLQSVGGSSFTCTEKTDVTVPRHTHTEEQSQSVRGSSFTNTEEQSHVTQSQLTHTEDQSQSVGVELLPYTEEQFCAAESHVPHTGDQSPLPASPVIHSGEQLPVTECQLTDTGEQSSVTDSQFTDTGEQLPEAESCLGDTGELSAVTELIKDYQIKHTGEQSTDKLSGTEEEKLNIKKPSLTLPIYKKMRFHKNLKSCKSINDVRKRLFQQTRIAVKSPRKFIGVLKETMNRASPRKVELMKKEGWLTPESKKAKDAALELVDTLKEEQQKISKSRSIKCMKERFVMTAPVRLTSNPLLSKMVGLRRSKLVKRNSYSEWTRKVRKDAFHEKQKDAIHNFYQRPQNCTFLPLYKLVTKDNQPCGYLTKSTKQLHEEYCQETGDNVGLTKFRQWRPKQCHCITKTLIEQCMCDICINIEEKCKTLNGLLKNGIDSSVVRHETMCEKKLGTYSKECIYRTCNDCGVQKIDKLVPDDLKAVSVTWKKWQHEVDDKEKDKEEKRGQGKEKKGKGKEKQKRETKQMKKGEEDKQSGKEKDKQKKGGKKKPDPKDDKEKLEDEENNNVMEDKEKKTEEEDKEEGEEESENEEDDKKKKKTKKKGFITNCTTVAEMLEELKKDMVTFTAHAFEATWQQERFVEAKAKLEEGEVLEVLDFAENYRTFFQNEPQAMHWQYSQVTIHPIVTYYKCPQCKELVTETCVCISKDLTHDGYAVKEYTNKVHKHLKEVRGLSLPIIKQFSDGAASQYKSRKPFTDISEQSDTIIRNFFGSRHGKSPADGATAVVKKLCAQAVKSGKVVISDAHGMWTFLEENHTIQMPSCDSKNHNARTFLYFDTVPRDIKSTVTTYRVENTRLLHAVQNIGVPGALLIKRLTCWCDWCITGGPGKCQLGSDQWSCYDMTMKPSRKRKHDEVTWPSQARIRHASEQEPLKKSQSKLMMPSNASDAKAFMRSLANEPQNMRLAICESLLDELPTLKIRTDLSVRGLGSKVDVRTQRLLPQDTPRELVPTEIMADGDCLPHCGSLLLFGSQMYSTEVRLRIAIELILHEDLYLDDKFLSRGHEGVTAVKMATFSDEYIHGQAFSVVEIYRREITSILQEGVFCGVWQLAALASVLSVPIMSVYPEKGSQVVRRDLHRVFLPRDSCDTKADCVHIAWTSTRDDMNDRWWNPNHFVVLVPYELPEEPQDQYVCQFCRLEFVYRSCFKI
jgi:hypothetical protein